MFESLEVFDLATARARHAALRQNVVAENVANADTPGFRAQDLRDFEDIVNQMRPGDSADRLNLGRRIDAGTPISPNGNSVSLEIEMMKSVDAQRSHSRAMMVYQHAMTVLRTSIGR